MSLQRSFNRLLVSAYLTALVVLSSVVFAARGSELAGVVGISPEGPDNFFVVRLTHQQGMSIAGIEFYNNDPLHPIQEVYAAEVDTDEVPRIDRPVTQLSVETPSEGWIAATFAEPVEFSGSALDIYLRMPAGSARTGSGIGGGAGIGYLDDVCMGRSYVSYGGRSFSALASDIALAVRISYTAGKREPRPFDQLTHTELNLRGGDSIRAADQSQPRALLSEVRVHPNPTNPHAVIEFVSGIGGSAEIGIHDSRGRLVRQWRIQEVSVGENSVRWNGQDNRGREVASGVYLVRVRTDAGVASAKAIVLR